MMNIAVVASNGKASRAIIEELVTRGHEVTAFARHEESECGEAFCAEGYHGAHEGGSCGL